jgi:flagellar basal body-associated protein FliL
MGKVLAVVGIIWTMIGVFVVLAAFGGQGIATFMGGVGLGIFPGLVLFALGHISEDVGIWVKRLAPKEHVPASPQPEHAEPAPPLPEGPPRARPGTRPPWEKS